MRQLPPAYITNERWKSISRALFQLGSALVGASAVRVYSSPAFDTTLALWAIGAGILIWSGWMVLGMLESEKDA